MPTAFGYIRVSSEKQAVSGLSMESQRQTVTGLLGSLPGLTPGKVFADPAVSSVSVPLFQRPAGAELLAALGRGDVVVCAALDRMFRDLADQCAGLAHFQKHGVRIYNAAVGRFHDLDDPAERFLVDILGVTAGYVVSNNKQKTRAAIRGGLDRGEWGYPTVPIGWKRASAKRKTPGFRRLVPDDAERQQLDQLEALVKRVGPSEAYRVCKRAGVRFRNHAISHPFSILKLTREWTKQKNGEYTEFMARYLNGVAAAAREATTV